jgi:hypothetical protein
MEPTERGLDQDCIMNGVSGLPTIRLGGENRLDRINFRIDIVSRHSIGSAGERMPFLICPSKTVRIQVTLCR